MGLLVNCLTTDVHWKHQEREGTISGSPLRKALGIHHQGAEHYPTAHHLPFSFKSLTSVPSGGRNLGSQPGTIASTWLSVWTTTLALSATKASPGLSFIPDTFCAAAQSPGWLDRLVRGLHGFKCIAPSSVQPHYAQPGLEPGSWQPFALATQANLHIILLKWFEAHVFERGEKACFIPGISRGRFPFLHSKELVFVNHFWEKGLYVCEG